MTIPGLTDRPSRIHEATWGSIAIWKTLFLPSHAVSGPLVTCPITAPTFDIDPASQQIKSPYEKMYCETENAYINFRMFKICGIIQSSTDEELIGRSFDKSTAGYSRYYQSYSVHLTKN
jgi:hypothetical protein